MMVFFLFFYKGANTLPILHTPPSNHIPLVAPLPSSSSSSCLPSRPLKTRSINKRAVVEADFFFFFPQDFSGRHEGQKSFLLSAVQMGLMSPELEAQLVIVVLISCEN